MNLPPIVSRRHFLVMSTSLGLGGLLVACGGSTGSSVNTLATDGDLQIVKRFPVTGLVPGRVRLPISLADKSGVLSKNGKVELPQTLSGSVINADTGAVIHASVKAEQHSESLETPYWPFIFDVPTVGLYMLKIDIAPETETAFQIIEREFVESPLVGDPLPPFETPTTDNARGMKPICTWPEGTCPFHTQTLTKALQSGTPVVYLIGTPAYCKTGTCTPALGALIEVASTIGDIAIFVHADVYKDKTATEIAPAVQAYKLSYEPVLYVTDAQGKIVDRLDAVFDARELRSSLAAAGIS